MEVAQSDLVEGMGGRGLELDDLQGPFKPHPL